MLRRLMIVGTVAVVGCGGISKEQYGAKEAEAAKYQQQLGAMESKNKALEQQNATLQAQLTETSAAKSELEVTTAKMADRQSLRLSDRLLFKDNASTLTPESKRALDAIADAVAQLKDKHIIIAGYTDDAEAAGKDKNARRWQLSTARALNVAKYLAGRGIDPKLIAVAGFGEARPVAPNDSIANRALNRRVEIALTPSNLQLGTIDVKPAELKPK